MTTHRFTQLDVFTATALRGNPLAVVHDAQGLTDALMHGFGSAWSWIKQQVKAAVFKMTVQPVVQGAVNGLMGLGGGGSIMGDLSSLLSIGNSFSSGGLLGGAGAMLFGNSAAYGAALGTTSIGAGSQAAMLASQTGVFGAEGAALTAAAKITAT